MRGRLHRRCGDVWTLVVCVCTLPYFRSSVKEQFYNCADQRQIGNS